MLILRRLSPTRLAMGVSRYVSSTPAYPKSATQDPHQRNSCYTNNPMVAPSNVVPHSVTNVKGHLCLPPPRAGPCLTLSSTDPPPGCSQPSINSVANSRAYFSQRVSDVILNSTKQSTRHSYAQKWSRYCTWIQTKHSSPHSAVLTVILDFLLHLKDSGLS